MSTLSTHVLDTASGAPARGVRVQLFDIHGATPQEAVTDGDGRARPFGGDLAEGVYQLVFHVAEYFATVGVTSFYPKVTVEFHITQDAHYHIPLLLSPYGFTTYRGS